MAGSSKRERISKSTRFEVFKRDSFTCQYCGRKAPDVVLQIEHITPVAQGGSSDILNLLTACIECNSGKGARPLSESQAITKRKRHEQLAILQERREQLNMLYEWQRELISISEDEMGIVCDAFTEGTGYAVNDHGRGQLRRWMKRYGVAEVLEATREAVERYFQQSDDDEERKNSAEDTFNRIIRVIRWKRLQHRDPEKAEYLYAKAILRKRLNYINWGQLEQIIHAWISWSLTSEALADLAKRCSSWTHFRELVHQGIDRAVRAEQAERAQEQTQQQAMREAQAEAQREAAERVQRANEDPTTPRRKGDYCGGYMDGEQARQFYEEREVPEPEFDDESALYRKGWWDGLNQLEYFDPSVYHRDEEPAWVKEVIARQPEP